MRIISWQFCRGISGVEHLEDVSESDADEFKFVSKFQFNILLREYSSHKELHKETEKHSAKVSKGATF